MSKELDYINYCIVENECHIKRLDTTGYPVEIQKQYSDYLFKKREILSTIKQALTTKSKKEQAFDIANKKCVNMFRLAVVNDVNSYNKWVEFDEYWLTEEEFNLLKKVLYAKNI
jgi:hypothetical protein